MFHATFVVKHVKIIVETSILNNCNIETSEKINLATSQRCIQLQHPCVPSIVLATSKNLYCNLQHDEIPIAAWQGTPIRQMCRVGVGSVQPESQTCHELAPPVYLARTLVARRAAGGSPSCGRARAAQLTLAAEA
jgi:hypothetical protein